MLESFEALEENLPDEIIPVLDCFKQIYIGYRLCDRHRDPLFAHEILNMRINRCLKQLQNGD